MLLPNKLFRLENVSRRFVCFCPYYKSESKYYKSKSLRLFHFHIHFVLFVLFHLLMLKEMKRIEFETRSKNAKQTRVKEILQRFLIFFAEI